MTKPSPPSRSQTPGKPNRQSFAESGFGGWVDEKAEVARELVSAKRQALAGAPPLLSKKEVHPEHLTIP